MEPAASSRENFWLATGLASSKQAVFGPNLQVRRRFPNTSLSRSKWRGTEHLQAQPPDGNRERSAGHLVLKPFVQNRRSKTPESTDLDSRDLAVACHFLERLGMDLQESCSFVTVEQLFESQLTNLGFAGWLVRKIGHCDLRAFINAA